MTKYLDKSFTVAQPGDKAKQWPKCGKYVQVGECKIIGPNDIGLPKDSMAGLFRQCDLDLGHKGDCKPAEDECS